MTLAERLAEMILVPNTLIGMVGKLVFKNDRIYCFTLAVDAVVRKLFGVE